MYVCLPEVCFLLRCTANSSILLCCTQCEGRNTYTTPCLTNTHASACFSHTQTLFFANQLYWIPATIGAHPLATQAAHICAHAHIHTQTSMTRSWDQTFVPSACFLFLQRSHLHTQVRSWHSEIVLSGLSAPIWAHTLLSHPQRRRRSLFNFSHIYWLCVTEKKVSCRTKQKKKKRKISNVDRVKSLLLSILLLFQHFLLNLWLVLSIEKRCVTICNRYVWEQSEIQHCWISIFRPQLRKIKTSNKRKVRRGIIFMPMWEKAYVFTDWLGT